MDYRVVTIPLRTCSEANMREHWAKKAKRVKKQREAVLLVLRSKGIPKLDYYSLFAVDVTLTRLAPRFLDIGDNLNNSFKAIRDAIADDKRPSVLGIDDNDPRIKWVYAQEKSKEYGVRVEITIEPVELRKGKAKTWTALSDAYQSGEVHRGR